MYLKTLLGFEGLNKILKDRGIVIQKIEHKSQDFKKVIDKCKFRVMYNDTEKVEFDDDVTESIMEVHNLNYLMFSRGVELLHVVNEDKDLFKSFTNDFTLKLRFFVKYSGEWIPPWNVKENRDHFQEVSRSPLVQQYVKK